MARTGSENGIRNAGQSVIRETTGLPSGSYQKMLSAVPTVMPDTKVNFRFPESASFGGFNPGEYRSIFKAPVIEARKPKR